ncbi:proteasome accessory factor PafA2 family protein [Candidatus Woesearchaeota archaeon]|nr:proteasome accessory factor PafA2 family protein [Candidatus Woesearchaeota archaeon]
MKPRVYGEETEYGGVFISDKNISHPLAGSMLENLLNQAERKSDFLKNGARMYKDMHHIEYATPECLSPIDVVIYSKAGERILNSIAKENTTAQEAITLNPVNGRVRFFRHNVDGDGSGSNKLNTFGCHENYSYDPQKITLEEIRKDDLSGPDITPVDPVHLTALLLIYQHILPFLITRFMWTGSGNLTTQNGKKVYQLSQRIPHLNELSTSDTTSSRGVFNLRNEPHSSVVGRLHLICGDANMSEYQTYLKYGVTGIVLGMIEDGYKFDNLHFKEELRVLYDMNSTMNFHKRYEMAEGEPASPFDIQRAYLDCARIWATAHKDPEIDDVISLWEETLTMLEDGDPALAKRLDWVAKRKLIFKKFANPNRKRGELQQINLQYHDINPEKSLYYLLVNNGLMDTFLPQEDILHATDHAPPGSRAQTRQNLLEHFAACNRAGLRIDVKAIVWDKIVYEFFSPSGASYSGIIHLPSPYDTSQESIVQINASIRDFLRMYPFTMNKP